MDIWSSTQMDGQPGVVQANSAIAHALQRIRDHSTIGYYMGLGSQTFCLLTEAYATLQNVPVSDVRRNFQCTDPRDPQDAPRMPTDQKSFADAIGSELMARLERHADRGDFDVGDPKDFAYLLAHFLEIGLAAKDAELDAQTAELF